LTTAAIPHAPCGGLDQHQSTAEGTVSLNGAGPQFCEEQPMRAAWKLFCISAVVLAAALGLAHLLVPDIVPVAFAEEPQAAWAVLTAFTLRAIEMIAAAVATISLAALAGGTIQLAWSRASRDTRAPRCRTPRRS
jgi:hypothetical protein